jgi:hypothetical protein
MHKNPAGFFVLLTLVGLLIVLVLSASISSSATRARTHPESVGAPQDQTATPGETDLTQPGSTDGIMWLGVVIVTVVLLPILVRKETWR